MKGRYTTSLQMELQRLEAKRQRRREELDQHEPNETTADEKLKDPRAAAAAAQEASARDIHRDCAPDSESGDDDDNNNNARESAGAFSSRRGGSGGASLSSPEQQGGGGGYSGSRFDVLHVYRNINRVVATESKKAAERRQRTHQHSIHSCCSGVGGGGGIIIGSPSGESNASTSSHPPPLPPHSGAGAADSSPTYAGPEEQRVVAKRKGSDDGDTGLPPGAAEAVGGAAEEKFPYPCRIPSKGPYRRLLPQPFSHILVLDFEATCDAAAVHYPHEILEFPVVVLDTRTLEIVAQFHRYVRPNKNPQLTSFCTDLTGITQEMVDAAQPLDVVLAEFRKWLEAEVYPLCRARKQLWADACRARAPAATRSPPSSPSCGDDGDDADADRGVGGRPSPGDGAQPPCTRKGGAPQQQEHRPGAALATASFYPCAAQEVLDANGLSRNLQNEKKHFPFDTTHYRSGVPQPGVGASDHRETFAEEESMICFATDGPWDMRKFMFECEVLRHRHTFPPLFYRFINVRNCFTKAFQCKPMKLTHMLRKLHMTFEGRRHSGIDDTRNILRVLAELLARGYRLHHVSTVQYRPSSSDDLRHDQAASQLLSEFAGEGSSGIGAARQQRQRNNGADKKKKNRNGAGGGGGGPACSWLVRNTSGRLPSVSSSHPYNAIEGRWIQKRESEGNQIQIDISPPALLSGPRSCRLSRTNQRLWGLDLVGSPAPTNACGASILSPSFPLLISTRKTYHGRTEHFALFNVYLLYSHLQILLVVVFYQIHDGLLFVHYISYRHRIA
eukprot:gene877-507_t